MIRFAFAVATLVWTAHAGAEGFHKPRVPYPPGIRPFPIVLIGTPSELRFTLSTEKDGKPFAYCTGRCDALVPTGTYWVSILGTKTSVAGRRAIDLEEPSLVRVRAIPKDYTSAPSVVALSLIGGGLALVGLGLFLEDGDSQAATVGIGLTGLAGGFVLVFIGGAADARTTPEVSVSPFNEQ